MEVNLFTIFATVINFIVLILILKHFLFDKVNDVIENRNSEVIETINSAEAQKQEAEALKESCEKEIGNLENKGREILREAKAKADEQAKAIIYEAEQKVTALMKQSEIEIEREKKKALEDMREEIGALAILAAEKILEKQLDHQEQQTIIGKIIDETENVKWQN